MDLLSLAEYWGNSLGTALFTSLSWGFRDINKFPNKLMKKLLLILALASRPNCRPCSMPSFTTSTSSFCDLIFKQCDIFNLFTKHNQIRYFYRSSSESSWCYFFSFFDPDISSLASAYEALNEVELSVILDFILSRRLSSPFLLSLSQRYLDRIASIPVFSSFFSVISKFRGLIYSRTAYSSSFFFSFFLAFCSVTF